MKAGSHIIVSFSLGVAIWLFAKSFYAGLICFISGIVADFDHIVEFIIHYGWKDLSFGRIHQACEQTAKQEGDYRFRKLYLILHTLELAILLLIASIYIKNIYFLAVAIGYSVHLILDYTGNPLYPYSYFIAWRAARGFNTDRLIRKTLGKGTK